MRPASDRPSSYASGLAPALIRDPIFFPEGNEDTFDRFRKVRLLLVDDQFNLGYHDIVASLLFGSESTDVRSKHGAINFFEDKDKGREIVLESTSKPDVLYDALEGAVKPGDDLEMPRLIGKGLFDILLLDLRLFSASMLDSPSQDEAEFLKKLLDFFNRTQARRIDDPALKRAAEGAARREKGGNEDLYALTFLPLLLSHADPSLPIVLFSSTHQRCITEAFKPWPNIITAFIKPVIGRYDEPHFPSTYIRDLKEAMLHSLHLHEERVAWETLADCKDWGQFPVFEVKQRHPRNRRRTCFAVYNHPEETLPPEFTTRDRLPYVNGGSLKPRLTGPKISQRLAEDYCRYFLHKRYVDYLSVPREFLEGVLIPLRALTDPELRDLQFRLPYKLDFPNNLLSEIFTVIRNNKVHGHVSPWKKVWDESGNNRKLTIVLLLMLVDFIRRGRNPSTQRWDILEGTVRHYLISKYPRLRNLARQHDGVLVPRDLSANITIEWADFALLVMVNQCRHASVGNVVGSVVGDSLRRMIELTSGPKTLKFGRIQGPDHVTDIWALIEECSGERVLLDRNEAVGIVREGAQAVYVRNDGPDQAVAVATEVVVLD